jgi:hypothetical protein
MHSTRTFAGITKTFITLILLMAVVPAHAQDSDASKRATSIGLFPLRGFEPLPDHKSKEPDTARLKPQNFRFPDIDRKTLSDRLEMGVQLPDNNCKPSWGLFAFRINAAGKIDSTWYQGSLPTTTSDKILANIRGTEGRWIIKQGTKPTDVAWFVYPFFDTRGRFERISKCSEAKKELLKIVSDLSSLVINLFYQVDRDHNRATMITPTERDGIPKL